MSVAAAEKALAGSGIAAEQIGCIVLATVTHLWQTPSAAALVGHRIGAANAAAFDISAACAGFCHGLALADNMIRGGTAEYVLVIGCEKLTDMVSPTDRGTAFIFGDGAGAAVVGPVGHPRHRPGRVGRGRLAARGDHPGRPVERAARRHDGPLPDARDERASRSSAGRCSR